MEEENINELLDNALQDFTRVSKSSKKTKGKVGSKENVVNSKEKVPATLTEEQLLSMFTEAVQSNQNSSINDEIEKLSKLSVEESDALIKKKLNETINQMNSSSDAPSKDELKDLLSNLGGAMPDPGSFENLLPMMEGMMQSLLSKDLLYPPMKELAEKFPDWLADNRNKVSKEEFLNYNKQFDLTKKICILFEDEKLDETEAEKKKRFDMVMELMQEMQNLGHPPKDLVGENSPGFPMDAYGNPMLPEGMDPSQCSIQ